jgi:hypothetical protein
MSKIPSVIVVKFRVCHRALPLLIAHLFGSPGPSSGSPSVFSPPCDVSPSPASTPWVLSSGGVTSGGITTGGIISGGTISGGVIIGRIITGGITSCVSGFCSDSFYISVFVGVSDRLGSTEQLQIASIAQTIRQKRKTRFIFLPPHSYLF